MTDAGNDSKLSRRQFVGTAAAGALALGAVAGGTSLMPRVTAASAKPAASAASGAINIYPSAWDYSADVVVVGQGAAGCAAAITAHDAGSKVLILDKAPTADSGNSGVCGGITWFPVSGSVGGSVQDFITTITTINWGTVTDDNLTAAFCNGVAYLPTWFASLGAKTTTASTTTAVPRSLVTGLVSPSFQSTANWGNSLRYVTPAGTLGAGVDVMVFLQGQVSSRSIQVLQSTPAQRLFQDPTTKEVYGVQASDWKGNTLNVQANQGVILACGGFEANKEMAQNFEPWAHSNSAHISFWGTPYNTGDGIVMAQSVGGKLWHMNNKEWTGNGFGCKAACDQLGMGVQVSAGGGNYAIMVNRYGQRFMNEHIYTGHTAQLLPTDQLVELNGAAASVAPFDPEYSYLPTNLPSGVTETDIVSTDYVDYPNVPFFLVFDSRLMKSGPLHTGGWPGLVTALHPAGTQKYVWSSDNSAELAKGWIVQGQDPVSLATNIVSYDFFGRMVGMNGTALAATITKYNADCAAGKGDTVFGRPAAGMVALNNPPYYAMELCIGRLNTNGGPVHDQYGRTVDVYNNPIPRLYTVGELGSIFGYLYYGGGNFPEAMIMGRLAGAHAASLGRYSPTYLPT